MEPHHERQKRKNVKTCIFSPFYYSKLSIVTAGSWNEKERKKLEMKREEEERRMKEMPV